MSVIIRLQNLPWSANAMDIRNYFRGLSIPEGGVHIVGGEQGDAFIAFSTDEDARQAMMNDGGKIKEIQVKLLLSSRSEMHKVIEAARQSVPILQLQPQPVMVPPTPFTPALSSILNPGIKQSITSNTIPGLGSPMEIPPQPAVIEPPVITSTPDGNDELEQDKDEKKKDQKSERRRTRSRSRSREREKKDNRRDRKDRRDRSRSRDRSRERRRRERSRSRSRERRDRKRDRRERSRSRERSKDTIQNRRSRDMRSEDKRNDASEHSNSSFADKTKKDIIPAEKPFTPQANFPSNTPANMPQNIPLNIPQNIQAMQAQLQATLQSNMPLLNPMSRPFAAFGNGNPVMGLAGNARPGGEINRFANDNGKMDDTYSRLQELGNKRNPNAFQGSDKSGPGPGLRRPPGDRDQQGYVGRDDRNLDRDLNNHQQRRFNRAVPPNCCIKMTNVPTYLGYGDVRRFFAGNFISNQGIKMINDHRGRRTGIVYIKFNELKGKQAALSKDGWEMNNERVKVEHADDKEFDNAIDAYMPIRHVSDDEHEETTSQSSLILVENDESQRFRGPFTVLRISDLPNYTKEHDLIKKFSDYSLLSIMLMDCKQTKTRTAYIQFVKSEDAKAAFQKKELYLFGRKQAPVSPCSEDDYEKEKNNYNKDIQHSNEEPAPAVEAPRDPRQRRLPAHNSEATTTTAQPLFPPGSVFPPPVFPGPPFVNPGAFPGPGFPPALMPGGPRPLWSAASQVPADEESVDCVLMKGLSPRASDRTIIDFFSEVKVVPSRIHLMLDHNGRPSGDCFCEFRTPEEASLAASRRGSLLENREISIDLVDRKVVEDALEGPKIEHSHPEALLGDGPQFRGPAPMMRGDFNQRGSFRGGFFNGPPRGRGIFDRGGFRGRGGPPMRGGRGFIRGGPRGGFNSFNGGNGGGSDESSTVPDSFGKPGCVVSLENVPFRAGIEEILEFFSNFELTQDDVIRRFNDRGMPTGDARVCFRTPFDAQRAVKTLNMSPIRDRPVGLQIV